MSLDDLSPLRSEKLIEGLAKLEDLVAQGRRAFLLGAGASKCAGLPLTSELTEKVLASEQLSKTTKQILFAICEGFKGIDNAPNIEDYLSELIDLIAIAERRVVRKATSSTVTVGGSEYSADQLLTAAEEIKEGIYEVIHVPASAGTHRRLVQTLHAPSRPGKSGDWQVVDYLVLNYDTLIEDALALERAPFSDGFEGGGTGWWSPAAYDRKDVVARVMKLHGSINWCELPGDSGPRRLGSNVEIEGKKKILIWPASTKYRETQLDPYAQLLSRLRVTLYPGQSSQVVLVICGYSFGDAHINIEIDRALRASRGNLTVIALVDDESPQGKLLEWHEDKVITNQVLVYARRGFFHGSTRDTSDSDLPWWKFENLVRILEGER